MRINIADRSPALMLTICILLVWIASVQSSQSPRMSIKLLSGTILEISCYVDANTEGLRKIYRVQNSEVKLMFSVMRNASDCVVSTKLPVEAVQCDCNALDRVVCNVSDKHIEGDQWKCATFQYIIPDYSNNAILHVYNNGHTRHIQMPSVHFATTSSINFNEDAATTHNTLPTNVNAIQEVTTYLMIKQYSKTTNLLVHTSEEVTQTSESHTQTNAPTEITSSSLLGHSSNKPDDSSESKSTSFTNDIFYQRFIIIISASSVAAVSVAAGLLICVYKKYNLVSDALESVIAPIEETSNIVPNTNAILTDFAAENRQSTVDIYESIPLMMVSPIADCFPLQNDVHNLDTFSMSGSESNNESVHYYESVPASPKSDGPSVEVESHPYPTPQFLYESLLRTRTKGNTQHNTISHRNTIP